MCRQTHGVLRQSHPPGSLNHFYCVFSSGFLWPVILIFLILSLYLIYLMVLPCMRAYFLAKMDSIEEAYGQVDITYCEVISPLLTSKEPFCIRVVREVSLTSRLRNMWSFIYYLGRIQLLFHCCYFGVSVHRGQTAWGPSISYLQATLQGRYFYTPFIAQDTES